MEGDETQMDIRSKSPEENKNKWSEYIEENFQLKEHVANDYIKILKKDIIIDGQVDDDFVDFIENGNTYVDKTLFIKYILNHKFHMILTYPRRTGKSLNLSTLKAFLETDGNDKDHYIDGKYDFNKGNKNKKLFTGGQIFSQDLERYITLPKLEIAKEDEFQYQGKFPVIYLNLKGVNSDEDEIFDSQLRDAISITFLEHKYLKEWLEQKKDNYELNKFVSYSKGKDFYIDDELGKITKLDITKSIVFLSRLLHKYYGKEVFLLVDEFDKPVNAILCDNNFLSNTEKAKKRANQISNIIKPCSKGNNKCVKRIILTGILNSEVISISSELNNLKSEGFKTGAAGYYGFNTNEINWLLDRVFNFPKDDNYLKDLLFYLIKYWYNGLIFDGKEVFTPSSVMSFFLSLNISKPKFDTYWGANETTKILRNFAVISKYKSHKEVMEILLDISYGKFVKYDFDPNQKLYNIIDTDLNMCINFKRLVFYYLFKSGYITQSKNAEIKLAANEVKQHFKREIIDYWLEEVVFPATWDKFVQHCQIMDFYNDEKKVIEYNISKIANIAKKGLETLNEKTFQNILFSAITNSKKISNFKFTTELKSGIGFLDIVIYFDDRADIYELKYMEKTGSETVTTILQKALDQIYGTYYMLEPVQKNIKNIRLIPMLLYKTGTETEYICKIEIITHTINEAKEIVIKDNKNLKKKIDTSTYNFLFLEKKLKKRKRAEKKICGNINFNTENNDIGFDKEIVINLNESTSDVDDGSNEQVDIYLSDERSDEYSTIESNLSSGLLKKTSKKRRYNK